MSASTTPLVTARQSSARWSLPLPAPAVLLSAAFIALLLICVVAPGLICGGDPFAIAPRSAFEAPGWAHPFGTDQSGRDILTRVIYGARQSLLVGVGATAISLVGALALGLTGGLSGPWTRRAVTALIDVLVSFPVMILALLFAAIFGHGIAPLAIAIGIATAPGYARMVLAQVLSVRRSGYVEAAVALGHRRVGIVWRHIIPNALRPLVVTMTMAIGQTIVWASGLSFLGLGAAAPAAEWGTMLSMGRDFIADAWWLTFFPGLFIVFTVLATTTIGRELQRHLDGRAGGRRA